MDYGQILNDSMGRWIARGLDFLPVLLSALLLVAGGWLVATVFKVIVSRLMDVVLDRLSRQNAINRGMVRAGLSRTATRVVRALVFWVIWLFFIAAAIDTLQLDMVAGVLNNLAYYLPRVLLALFIVFAGILGGHMVRATVSSGADRAGIRSPEILGRIAQAVVVVLAVVVAADQVGIQSTFLMITLGIALGTALGGLALAFGLGSGTTVSNIISSYYLNKVYRVGQTVRIDNLQGRIVGITATAVLIDSGEGQIMIPAKKFSEQASALLTGD